MRSLHPLVLALTLAAGMRPLAAPAWTPDRAIGEGRAGKLVLDGSRVCAATAVGVYCRERNQEAWQPAFLAGKYVVDLVRTRSGWLAWLSERSSAPPHDYAINLYVSRDGGAQWKPGRFPLQSGWLGQQGLGDSLVRNDAATVMLSKDGGESWDSLPRPLENTWGCTLSPGAVLCASKTRIFGHAGTPGWTLWGVKDEFDQVDFFNGRIYIRNAQGVLSEYTAAGLERKFPPLPGFALFFASDSLLIANSGNAYAFARGGDTAWTLSPATYAYTGFHPQGGAWQDDAAIVLGSASPWKARLEGGVIRFEPYGQGIPSLAIRRLYPSGRALFAETENAIWRSDAPGVWKTVFQRESWISPFFFLDGKAMVGSYHVNAGLERAAPSRFSDDSGKTWQDQPASLPGFLYGMTRAGGRYLAITLQFPTPQADSSGSGRWSLYEADAWMGPWKFRADYGLDPPAGFMACGPRLFTQRYSEAWTSLDTGKTWRPTGYSRVLEAGGDRVYALDSGGGLWEAANCVEDWARVPVSLGSGGGQVINRTRGEPLVAVYAFDSSMSRIHPLPGASALWAGIEAFPLPGMVESLVSRDDALYAVVREAGLYVLDMRTNGVRPRPARSPAGTPGRFSGWRRVDGRMMQAGAPVRTPLFRPALPE